MHPTEIGMQPLHGVEHVVSGHRDAGASGQHRPQRLDHPPLHRPDALHVPRQRLGQGEQAKGLRGRRAINHDDVVVTAGGHAFEFEQGEHLFGARDHGQFLRGDRIDPRRIEDRPQISLDLRPGFDEPALGIDLMHP